MDLFFTFLLWFVGANILITRGNVLKIADWGLARSYQTTQSKELR